MVLRLTFLIILDQITKAYFSARDFFVPNYGLPFNLNFGATGNLVVVSGLVVGFVWYYVRSKKNIYQQWGFALLFAGAIGNLVDRVIFGFVRDFIHFGLPFTFNLADVFVVIGLILILFPITRE